MDTGSTFPANKAAGVRQTLQTFVDTNVKESLAQERKSCFQNINATNLKIRKLGYVMVIGGNSDGTLH